MAISDFFRAKAPPAESPKPQQQTTQQQNATITQQKESKPNQPLDTTQKDFSESGDSATKNPLDSFAGMYDNKTVDPASAPPVFALDPTALSNASQSLKFSSHVTPELAQKLQSGDPAALAEAFDAVGRQVYQTVMSHQSTLTNRFVDARAAHDRKSLGQSVHSVLTANSLAKLAETNPQLKSHVTEIGDKIMSIHPDATPDWIAEQTKNYFVTIAKQLDPTLDAKEVAANKTKAEDINWEEWITAGSKN